MARDCSCTHTAKISFLLTLLWWEGAGAIPSSVQTHCKQQIPFPCVTLSSKSQQKLTAEFTSWFSIQDGKTLIRVFPLLLYMGLSFSLTLKERHPACVPPEKKEARGVLTGSGTHAVTEKGSSSNTHTLREDRLIITFRGD